MSKITKKQLHNGWHCHDTEIIKMKKELRELKQSILRLEKLTDEKLLDEPQLKQLDQSVFDGTYETWRFASIDADGAGFRFAERPELTGCFWRNVNGSRFDRLSQSGTYDASNWQNSLIERDIAKELIGSELTRKMLTGGADKVNCYVSDDSDYDALIDKVERTIVGFSDGWFHTNSVASWKYAVPAPKEKELTGSELCKAMLARGDKYVMCMTGSGVDIIDNLDCPLSSTCPFIGYLDNYSHAVPINNQGEPLAASEVGL